MKYRSRTILKVVSPILLSMITLFLTVGCATQTIDWSSRVGNYTYDQAVMDYGPPDKHTKLEDGTMVAEWLTRRGYQQSYVTPGYYGHHGHCYVPVFPTVVNSYSPDYYLRLTFSPDGKLKTWRKFAR